jgi:23S rRNA-/tRNA-specific pseudouridylate synthase
VHFKAINHPVICDSLYAENKPKLLGFERLALHARKIEISDINGDILTIEAPLPPDFVSALDKIKDLC